MWIFNLVGCIIAMMCIGVGFSGFIDSIKDKSFYEFALSAGVALIGACIIIVVIA